MAKTRGDDWMIERLGSSHDRTGFDCGNPILTDWLRQRASQFEKRDLARTYVASKSGSRIVLGYYAISNHRVSHEALPADEAKGLPRLDVPVVLLGRLAVDRTVQGQGLGSLLLDRCITASASTSPSTLVFGRWRSMRSMMRPASST